MLTLLLAALVCAVGATAPRGGRSPLGVSLRGGSDDAVAHPTSLAELVLLCEGTQSHTQRTCMFSTM